MGVITQAELGLTTGHGVWQLESFGCLGRGSSFGSFQNIFIHPFGWLL